MKKFRDRDKAIKNINSILDEQATPLMVLSGGKRTGKTEFAKYISEINAKAIYLSPGYGTLYAGDIICSIKDSPDFSLYQQIVDFAKRNARANQVLQSLGIQFASSLKSVQVPHFVNLLIREDISSGLYLFAHFLGENCLFQSRYIFLDDFHRCDQESYKWLVQFWRALTRAQSTIIAICNFELDWESDRLNHLFAEVPAPVNIEQFDSEQAYFDVLKDSLYFENDTSLANLSKQLYALYDGNAQLLFETIKMLETDVPLANDRERISQILQIAQKIRFKKIEGLSNTHLLVLKLLAHCDVPIPKDCIIEILEISDEIVTEILGTLYNGNFLCPSVDMATGRTLYGINGEILSKSIKSGCTQHETNFFEIKIYRAIRKKQIAVSLEQQVKLSIRLGEDDALKILSEYCAHDTDGIHTEKEVNYLDKLLQTMTDIPAKVATVQTAQFLYAYGYYSSAEKIMCRIITDDTLCTYDNLLLLGDIQHLLLSPSTSQTFKRASEIPEISISDKCKAINRQIMALNQEHQEELAEKLYRRAFKRFEKSPSIGLVELYRNTNNSFDYEDAIRYTAKGYHLAENLGDELEMYKCLHNICMIQLQYGQYEQPLKDNLLGFIPKFEDVLRFFASHSEYWHEQAYPLLDLGVAQMFKYVLTSDKNYLAAAKKYYSEAQLYARSFYARHIAEYGLLVVNSYLYHDQYPFLVNSQRESCYRRYVEQKEAVADYRVHRKILQSLALSALISGENQEAADYLSQAFRYIRGYETERYNRLCQRAGCTHLIKAPVPLKGRYDLYYCSDKIVPWIISLAH